MSTNKPIYKLLDWIDENKLNWNYLSKNKNAIKLLKKNQDKINWYYLSENINAIELLKENQNKIDWDYFSNNPTIFELDYKQMTKNIKPITEEILEKVYNPDRINRLMVIYNFKFEDWFN